MTTKVICINDKDRPSDIKESNWIEQGKIYTVKRFLRTNVTGDYYVKLEEVDPNCPPYMGYNAKRFASVEITPDKEEVEYELNH